jgi:Na+-translocating ferredoxin:NAD+ oxidoreductase subunit A
VNGDGFVVAIVAAALANRLMLAAPTRALPPLRAVALHGVVAALVATATIVIAYVVHALLAPLALVYPMTFIAVPIGALLTALAAVLLPRWRAALRDQHWRLIGATSVVLAFIAPTAGDASLVVLRAFITAAAFALALVVLVALELRLQPSAVPAAFRGLPIALLNAGLLALAGHGLNGLLPV